MSGDGPESIPTSADPRSKRPVKKRALTPVSAQAATVEALFAKPDQDIRLPRPLDGGAGGGRPRGAVPPEIMTNVQGSSSGAGSGEFHVYKASRRREYARLRGLDAAARREREAAGFEEARRARETRDDEKTRRNREKREKAKVRKAAKDRAGPGPGPGPGPGSGSGPGPGPAAVAGSAAGTATDSSRSGSKDTGAADKADDDGSTNNGPWGQAHAAPAPVAVADGPGLLIQDDDDDD